MKYKQFYKWLQDQAGRVFKIVQNDKLETYIDESKQKRKITCPAKDPKKLLEYLKKYYTETYDDIDTVLVEIHSNYKYFRVKKRSWLSPYALTKLKQRTKLEKSSKKETKE